MRKVCVFTGLVIVLSVIFACTIPESIDIVGTPKIKFTANMDFGGMFSDSLKDAFNSSDGTGGFKKLDCINGTTINGVAYQTLLIRMELVNDEFDFTIDSPGQVKVGENEYNASLDGSEITFDEDVYLVKDDGEQAPMTLDFSSLNEYLEGFNFDEEKIEARLYISGSEIASKIYIDLSISDEILKDIANKASGIDSTNDKYSGNSLPAGGKEIENFGSLLNKKEETEITYDVYMPDGTKIDVDLLDDVNIYMELVVWIPLYFKAADDNAKLAFPDDFIDGISDFIDSISEAADSLSLVIDLNPNPFTKGTLYVQSKGIEIKEPLSSTSLNFIISEENMQKIIDPKNSPFKPKFSIVFDKGENLGIPKELKITTISLEAKLNYTVEL